MIHALPLEELWIARAVLRNQGARTDLGANAPKLTTWADYCEDIGVNKRTANRWLRPLTQMKELKEADVPELIEMVEKEELLPHQAAVIARLPRDVLDPFLENAKNNQWTADETVMEARRLLPQKVTANSWDFDEALSGCRNVIDEAFSRCPEVEAADFAKLVISWIRAKVK